MHALDAVAKHKQELVIMSNEGEGWLSTGAAQLSTAQRSVRKGALKELLNFLAKEVRDNYRDNRRLRLKNYKNHCLSMGTSDSSPHYLYHHFLYALQLI